jgi:hypothetical protein
VSPTEVILLWEAMEDIDGYKISSINPDTGARAAAIKVDDPDATTAAVTLPPSTRMCFQIKAVRGELESEFSPGSPDQVCDETEAETVEESAPPGVPSPSVTVAPDMSQVGGGGEPTGGGGGGETADEPPLDFVTVMRTYSSDLETDARAEQERLADAGVPAKLLTTEEYGLAPPGAASPTGATSPSPAPTPTGETVWLVYVDGASAVEAQTACASAISALTAAGETPPSDACLITFQVVSRPSGEASPTV